MLEAPESLVSPQSLKTCEKQRLCIFQRNKRIYPGTSPDGRTDVPAERLFLTPFYGKLDYGEYCTSQE